jgi:polyvinyl alcohol dehydrogenase (cytochrome)
MTMKHATTALVLLLVAAVSQTTTAGRAQGPAPAPAAPSGEAIYMQRCAGCHDNATGRTPAKAVIQGLTRSRIMRTLDFGAMMTIAYPLRRDEREAVATYLGRPVAEPGPRPEAFCSDRTVRVGDLTTGTWNGWSPRNDNTRFVPADLAGLTAADVPQLKLRWAFGFEGDTSAFGQPTVIGNQIFVGSAGGVVYALRADSGCIQWTYQAVGPIRSAIVATKSGNETRLLFGDLTGWFYALNAADGAEQWKKRPEPHEAVRLSAPPLVRDGIALVPVASWEETRTLNTEYECCTFRGSLVALRVTDGAEVWRTYTIPRPPEVSGKTSAGVIIRGPSGVGVWGSPAVDEGRGRIYIGTGNNYSEPATDTSDAVMALDLKTGRIIWSRQAQSGDVFNAACAAVVKTPQCPASDGPDFDFGAPTIYVRAGGRDLVLAGQKSGVVWAFDAARNGTVLWQRRVGNGGINGGILWGMAADDQHVYATVSDAVIQRTGTVRTIDPTKGGGLSAVNIRDGSVAWRWNPLPCDRPNCSPAQSAALTVIPGVVFAGSMDGHLRAHDTRDGTVIWDFDTARDFTTVNGVPGKGGALDGPGAIVANGMVLVNSGYTRQGGMPGNVLLAFAAGQASR